MDVIILNSLLRPILTVTTVWNTGETGDMYPPIHGPACPSTPIPFSSTPNLDVAHVAYITFWNSEESSIQLFSIQIPTVLLYFSLKKVKKNDWTILFGLKKTWDVNIYIHSPGDEIWLIFISFPVEVAHIRLDSNNSDGVWSSDLSITENEIVHLDTENAHCKLYAEKVNISCGCHLFLSWGTQVLQRVCSLTHHS